MNEAAFWVKLKQELGIEPTTYHNTRAVKQAEASIVSRFATENGMTILGLDGFSLSEGRLLPLLDCSVDFNMRESDLSNIEAILEAPNFQKAELIEFFFGEQPKNVPSFSATLNWQDLPTLKMEDWWKGDATKRIEAQIGISDDNQPLSVYFGVDDENRPCAHGAIIAMTGAGKTALFHTLIASLATRYSPQELQLVLMDGKMGVGFNAYRTLPHVEAISLNTKPALARSLLAELVDEMLQRNALFKEYGVEHFIAYRQKDSPGGILPRILLIADEYQILFEDDQDEEAASTLLKLSEQARSVGIHLLLGSQHASPAYMSHRDLIFSNIHLRIAMKMPAIEITSSSEFGPNARALIEKTCTKTGRVVINDHAGDDTKNISGAVAFLDDSKREVLIEHLSSQSINTKSHIILDGDSQPGLYENPIFMQLLTNNYWDNPAAVQQFARKSIRDNGLGVHDWSITEHPIALFLGRKQSVRGQALVVLRRRQYENVCIVGESQLERTSMLASSMVSACLQFSPKQLGFFFADGGLAGEEWSDILSEAVQAIDYTGYKISFAQQDRDITKVVTNMFNEMTKRQSLRENRQADLPSVIFVLSEAERVQALQRIDGDYGPENSVIGQQLESLLEKGPSVGIHVLAAFSTLGAAKTVLDERKIQLLFRHKIAMQMSEDDSFDFVRNPGAAKLQEAGPKPIMALFSDSQANRQEIFSPYALGQTELHNTQTLSNSNQINDIFNQLRQR